MAALNLDQITKEFTALNNFGELLRADYTPTLNAKGRGKAAAERITFLSNAYDQIKKQIGSDVRAFRGFPGTMEF